MSRNLATGFRHEQPLFDRRLGRVETGVKKFFQVCRPQRLTADDADNTEFVPLKSNAQVCPQSGPL